MDFQAIKIFWEKQSQKYNKTHSLTTDTIDRVTGKYYWKTLATILKHYPQNLLAGSKVLDFGCGTGRLAKGVAPLCAGLVCLDISAAALGAARQNLAAFDNIAYVQFERLPLEFPDGYFDFCYAYASLCYASTEDEFDSFLSEIDRTCLNFCIQLHGVPCEQPCKDNTIAHAQGDDLFQLEYYRPTITTIKKKFPGSKYSVELNAPDIRGPEPFLYKKNW